MQMASEVAASDGSSLFTLVIKLSLEEDKRATTNVQNGLVFFLFSFILFSSL